MEGKDARPRRPRGTISAWAGDAGRAWLAGLPRLVAECAELWGLAVGEAFQPSGYTSFAAPATRADGMPCVLKVRYPDEWSVHEGAALRHYGGRGAVECYAEDTERWALLLERCLPGTALLAEPDDVATRVVAETVVALWSPAPERHAFPLLASHVPRWAETVRRSGVLDAALRDETLDALSWLSGEGGVVLHTDLHPANVLRAGRAPWLAIDPKGLVGDPAFDLAPVLRDRATPENVGRRFAVVREVTGLDPARLRGWALVQAAEGAAWCAEAGDAGSVAPFVRAAECVRSLRA